VSLADRYAVTEILSYVDVDEAGDLLYVAVFQQRYFVLQSSLLFKLK
jgi:hypothetical protein